MSPIDNNDIKCQSQIEWWWWFLSRILQFRIFFFNLTFPPPPFVKNKQMKNILKYALYRFESKLLLSFCHYPTGTKKKIMTFLFLVDLNATNKKCWSSLWLTIMIRQIFYVPFQYIPSDSKWQNHNHNHHQKQPTKSK